MSARAMVGLLVMVFWSSLSVAGDEAAAPYIGSGKLERRLASVGDSEFEYFVYRPGWVTEAAPVLFALHGGGGSAELTRAAGYELLADIDGFIVVYPNAPGTDWAVAEFFGTPPHADYPESVRDVAYFDAMLDALIADRLVDPGQVFVSGGSRGGLMAMRLVCERAGRIRAAAATRMVMPAAWGKSCKPERPVSLMLMMGTVDPLVPFAGGVLTHKDMATPVLSFEDTTSFWRKLNECPEVPASGRLYDLDPDDGIQTQVQIWRQCAAGAQVAAYRVVGMGHPVPGVRIPPHLTGRIQELFGKPLDEVVGPNTRDFHGPTEEWRFFHGLPGSRERGHRD